MNKIKTIILSIIIGSMTYVVTAQTKLFSMAITDQAITINFPNATAAQTVIDAIAARGSFAPNTTQTPAQQEAAKRQFVIDEIQASIADIILTQRITVAARDAANRVPKDDIPVRPTPTPTPLRVVR